MKRTKKKFDCIEFKQKAQERIYEEIKGMSWKDEINYFKKYAETGPMGIWWKKVKEAQQLRKHVDMGAKNNKLQRLKSKGLIKS